MNQEKINLRTALLRELARLKAAAHEGGPFVIAKNSTVYAVIYGGIALEVTQEMMNKLSTLPDEAGAEKVKDLLWDNGGVAQRKSTDAPTLAPVLGGKATGSKTSEVGGSNPSPITK